MCDVISHSHMIRLLSPEQKHRVSPQISTNGDAGQGLADDDVAAEPCCGGRESVQGRSE